MTQLLPSESIEDAAALLRAGRLVAFGTETVYGLGADATNGEALAAVFAAKGRPRFNPLICHFATARAAFMHAQASDIAHRLAAAFWPGPLTLVLPRAANTPINLLASAGLDTLAVRVPASDAARALLAACGVPVAAPSANRSGAVSPTTAAHVLADMAGRIDAVLDTGPAAIGLESTVLDLTGLTPFLLRPGGVTADAIEALAGPIGRGATTVSGQPPRGLRSPGLLASHYAPALPVRLNAVAVPACEALLAFGPPLQGAGTVFNLSETGSLEEAAANLFAGLRWLDAEGARLGLTRIAAMQVPAEGLGAAINDRLGRASAPRG